MQQERSSIKRIPYCAKRYCASLLFFLSVLALFLESYSQPFYIKKYTVDDGLPASYILRIYQDSYGFMWISTFNGLSRFDGKEFINYGYESGLSNIIIDAIYEDRHHRLWLGTRGGMAEVKGNRCLVYPVDDRQVINFVHSFFELQNGAVWALTSKGVYQFETDHWKKIKLYPGFDNHGCRQIIETGEGLLINYGHHLVLKNTAGTFQLLSQITDDGVPGSFFNNLFQQNRKSYLNRIDGLFEIIRKDSVSLFSIELKNKYLLWSLVDSKERFWTYTLNDHQLMVSEPGNTEQFFFKMKIPLVSSLFEDRDGNMWVAGSDGLLKFKAITYRHYENKFKPEIRGHVNVINLPNDQLVISAANSTMYILDEDSLENHRVKHSLLEKSEPHHEIIDASCSDERNKEWLIFREQLDLFTIENNRIKALPGLIKGNIHPLTGLAYNLITHKLYIGADTLQSGNESGFYPFRPANDDRYIIYPTSLHYFSNGLMMVDTRNNGSFIIDDKENIYPVSKASMLPYQVPGGVKIFDDPSGKFWIASSYGLTRYRWNEKMLPEKDFEITTKQGLPNSSIRSLCFDKLNRIWAATLSGIVVIEIDSLKNNLIQVNLLSEEQGITTDYWMEANLATDENGKIWIGLYNELIKIDPLKVEFENAVPSVAIDNIQLNFKETNWREWSDSLQGLMQIAYQPVLPYNKNNLGISFKGISFSYASGLEYSYKLEGADSNWSAPMKSNFVSFVGLPPSHYNFTVRTRKSNSEWSQPASFSFTIKKPFWSEWWFRILMLVLAAGIVYALYHYRINQFKDFWRFEPEYPGICMMRWDQP